MLEGCGVEYDVDTLHYAAECIFVSYVCNVKVSAWLIEVLLILKEERTFIVVYTNNLSWLVS